MIDSLIDDHIIIVKFHSNLESSSKYFDVHIWLIINSLVYDIFNPYINTIVVVLKTTIVNFIM